MRIRPISSSAQVYTIYFTIICKMLIFDAILLARSPATYGEWIFLLSSLSPPYTCFLYVTVDMRRRRTGRRQSSQYIPYQPREKNNTAEAECRKTRAFVPIYTDIRTRVYEKRIIIISHASWTRRATIQKMILSTNSQKVLSLSRIRIRTLRRAVRDVFVRA